MKKQKDFSKIIIVGITGYREKHWRDKLAEIEKLKISRANLFLEQFPKSQREKIYRALLKSKIKKIPLVHIRNDMTRDEFVFLEKNYHTRYFTIHENSFRFMKKWKGFQKKLYLEMNYDDYVPQNVKVSYIGGFCEDLAHFKAGEVRWAKDFEYILKNRKIRKYFKCNHLSGYSGSRNVDLHTIKSLKDFNYLKTLPKFLFGNVIAIEVYNSIAEQLKFKKYAVKILNG